MTRYIPIGDVEFRLDMIARALGIPAATLDRLVSGEWVVVPHHKQMTDDMAEVIAMQANVCGGIAYDIYRSIIEHQLATATEAGSHDD